jgi:hypothetical protein
MALRHPRQLRLSNPCPTRDRLELEQRKIDMPVLRRPIYQRSEGADEDRWGLVFDTDANRFFVEHESKRGDMRGSGYSINTEEIDVAAFLSQTTEGQHELAQLLNILFEEPKEARRP